MSTVPSSNSSVAFEPTEHPHRRFNPLTGKHVLVSPHRTKRPWLGQTEVPVVTKLPEYDEKCYLCPGNSRTSGDVNPMYKETYVFENDFPALLSSPVPHVEESAPTSISSLFTSEPVRGRCKVICFHPRHDLTLAKMDVGDIVQVVEGWKGVYEEEGRMLRETGSEGGYVQIFENRGSMMGASAPHPHGQVWTLGYVPDEPATELQNLAKHASANPKQDNLLLAYAAEEVQRKERVVEIDEEGGWVAVVPFWAVWPYETLLLPYKRHIPSILQLTAAEQEGLARIMKKLLVRYDNLFSCPFPYSMGLHQSPLPPTKPEEETAHVHFHFYPPLLRSASVRKFLVGFEMMGEAQRDLTAEQAAGRLRGVSDVHYTERTGGQVSSI